MANELENSNENSNEQNSPADLEARIKALEAENGKLKQSVTNASADASKWKKAMQEKDELLRAKMSEEEKANADRETAEAAMRNELETLRAERDISNYAGALSAPEIGMDAEAAKAVATSMHEGNMTAVIDGIRKFIASHDKALAEKAMLNNPTLPGGNSTKTVTKEQFDKMGYMEMAQFKIEHPELYKEYMNKS